MSTHNTAVLEINHGKDIVLKQPADAADLGHELRSKREGLLGLAVTLSLKSRAALRRVV